MSPFLPFLCQPQLVKCERLWAIMSGTEIVNDRIMWVFSQMKQSSNANSSELFVGLTAGVVRARFTASTSNSFDTSLPLHPPQLLRPLSSGKSTFNLLLTLNNWYSSVQMEIYPDWQISFFFTSLKLLPFGRFWKCWNFKEKISWTLKNSWNTAGHKRLDYSREYENQWSLGSM